MKNIVKLLLIIFALLILFIVITGCATKTEIVYKTEYVEIAIPQPCDAVRPPRPVEADSFNITLNRVLTYTEKIEALLDYCTHGKNINQSN